MRSSGPDGRVYFDDTSVVYDFTTVSPTAPSFAQKGHTAAMDARVAEKTKLYASKVTAGGEEFVIAGATTFGALSKGLRHMLIRAVNASAYDVDIDPVLRFVARFVATSSGRVIASAERKAGVIHQRATLVAPPAQAAQPAPTPAPASRPPTPAVAEVRPPAPSPAPEVPLAAPTPTREGRRTVAPGYESLTASRTATPTAEAEPSGRPATPSSVPPTPSPAADPQGRATVSDRPSSRPMAQTTATAAGQPFSFSFKPPASSPAPAPTSAFGQSAFHQQQGRPSINVSATSGYRFGAQQ
jgi:hypothetical protein